MTYIVELEPGVWIAPWKGDPGRTLVRDTARRFTSKVSAQRAVNAACKMRPFRNVKIVPATLTQTNKDRDDG